MTTNLSLRIDDETRKKLSDLSENFEKLYPELYTALRSMGARGDLSLASVARYALQRGLEVIARETGTPDEAR